MQAAVKQSQSGGNFKVDLAIDIAADEVDTLKSKRGIPPTDDSPKYQWDSAAGTGPTLPSSVRPIIDVKKVFHEKATAELGLVGTGWGQRYGEQVTATVLDQIGRERERMRRREGGGGLAPLEA